VSEVTVPALFARSSVYRECQPGNADDTNEDGSIERCSDTELTHWVTQATLDIAQKDAALYGTKVVTNPALQAIGLTHSVCVTLGITDFAGSPRIFLQRFPAVGCLPPADATYADGTPVKSSDIDGEHCTDEHGNKQLTYRFCNSYIDESIEAGSAEDKCRFISNVADQSSGVHGFMHPRGIARTYIAPYDGLKICLPFDASDASGSNGCNILEDTMNFGGYVGASEAEQSRADDTMRDYSCFPKFSITVASRRSDKIAIDEIYLGSNGHDAK
jgi:hypothetical protein